MRPDSTSQWTFYEFFAGGGLARLGLGDSWRCVFANDYDPAKAAAYARAFGAEALHVGDVWNVAPAALPAGADLAWASFPCQDLSLAGERGGLAAPRSGAFWGFWRLIEAQGEAAPPVIALENVAGLVSSHGGADFRALAGALARAGYRVGALSIDAAHFTPQSRPRIFIVAARGPVAAHLVAAAPCAPFHSEALIAAAASLPAETKRAWTWWRAPTPPLRNLSLADVLEDDAAVAWRSTEDTDRLLALMAPRQRAHVEMLRAAGGRAIGAAFRRIRSEGGVKVQRVEARFDGIAGCLRTPAGGSSRQMLLVIENGDVKSRLMSARECARLMGAPDEYPLPTTTTAALHLMGDAVAAPVVRWLGEHLLAPLAAGARSRRRVA